MDSEQITSNRRELGETLTMLKGLVYRDLPQPIQSRYEHTRQAVMEGLEKMMARQEEAITYLDGVGRE